MSPKPKTPTDELLDAFTLPRLAREVEPILRASPDAGVMTEDERRQLLAAHRKGEVVELALDIVAYRQSKTPRPLPLSRAGEANLNFYHFPAAGLQTLARSFRGGLLLRDHLHSQIAVGGDIVKASLVENEDWYEFHQTLSVRAPWAVEAALNKTIRAFSIGWRPKAGRIWDAIYCSVCDKKMFSRDCEHWLGDQADFPGSEERVVVEAVWKGCVGEESSTVPFPAVATGTRVDQVRVALAALRRTEPSPDSEDLLMDEETKKHLAELEARVAELDRQNKARDAELAAANEALRSTKTALQQLRDEKAAAASKAREDQIAALRTKARATGKFAPGTETEKLFDQLCALEDLAAAERFVAVLEPTLPIGVPPQYTPSAPGPAPTADKFAAALQRHGWSPDEIRIQRAMLRQQGTSEEIFLAQLTAHDAALADDAPPDAVGSPSLNPLPTLGFGGTAAFLTPGKE